MPGDNRNQFNNNQANNNGNINPSQFGANARNVSSGAQPDDNLLRHSSAEGKKGIQNPSKFNGFGSSGGHSNSGTGGSGSRGSSTGNSSSGGSSSSSSSTGGSDKYKSRSNKGGSSNKNSSSSGGNPIQKMPQIFHLIIPKIKKETDLLRGQLNKLYIEVWMLQFLVLEKLLK